MPKGQIFKPKPLKKLAGSAICVLEKIGVKTSRLILSTPLLLSLNGVMVVNFGFFLYGARTEAPLLVSVFLVTFAIYGLNKFTDRAEDAINRPETTQSASDHYLLFSVGSLFVGLLTGLLVSPSALILLLVPIIIGVIYSVKLSKSIPRLKEIVGVKSLAVALSWALIGSFLPNSFLGEQAVGVAVFFSYVFIKVFVGAILCDVLDMKGDLASGVETIPIKFAKKKTRNLLLVVNSLGIILVAFSFFTGLFLLFIPALLFGVVYGYLAIWFFFKTDSDRYAARLMLDGEWLPMVVIALFLVK